MSDLHEDEHAAVRDRLDALEERIDGFEDRPILVMVDDAVRRAALHEREIIQTKIEKRLGDLRRPTAGSDPTRDRTWVEALEWVHRYIAERTTEEYRAHVTQALKIQEATLPQRSPTIDEIPRNIGDRGGDA